MNCILCYSEQLHLLSAATQQADDCIKRNVPRWTGRVSEPLHALPNTCESRTWRTSFIGHQAVCVNCTPSSEHNDTNKIQSTGTTAHPVIRSLQTVPHIFQLPDKVCIICTFHSTEDSFEPLPNCWTWQELDIPPNKSFCRTGDAGNAVQFSRPILEAQWWIYIYAMNSWEVEWIISVTPSVLFFICN